MQESAEQRKGLQTKYIVLITIIASLLIIGCVAIALISNSYSKVIKRELTVEAGTQSVSLDDFIIQNKKNSDISMLTKLSDIDLNVPGTYTVKIKCDHLKIKCKLIVNDTVAPTATPVENTVLKGEELAAEKFVQNIIDVTKVTAMFKNKPDFEKVGKQDVIIILKDTSLNQTEIVAALTVVEDTIAPEIIGVKNISVYVGGTINYRKNISLKDDYDQNPTLTVDSSEVDISKEGSYTVEYTATDSAGNVATKTATVIVSRQVNTNEDKRLAAVELADNLIKKIIKDGMTPKEKVTAIYNWARRNMRYTGKSDKSDYSVEAYNALKTYSGDCFSYFSATKLMFERLGIANIDVAKVKNYSNDSNHFWSLVSIDGGQTYYHFDATPRKGPGDDFCLVTDAFLDAYSNSHGKSHNRDMSLYPATPTE